MKAYVLRLAVLISSTSCVFATGCQPPNEDNTCPAPGTCLTELSLSKESIIPGHSQITLSSDKATVGVLHQDNVTLSLAVTVHPDQMYYDVLWSGNTAKAAGIKPGPAQIFSLLLQFNGTALTTTSGGAFMNIMITP